MENILYVRNVWLDFEDGDMTPDEFPSLFPHLRMLILNTYHHTAEKPRYRIIIPTTQSVTPDVYKQLYGDFAAKLEDAGYFVRRLGKRQKLGRALSGLDWSKSSPTSLFYLPCRAEDPGQSFFKYYDDAGRTALDPVLWVENGPIPLQAEYEPWSGEDHTRLDLQHIAELLYQELQFARPESQNDRRAQVADIIKSMGRYREKSEI